MATSISLPVSDHYVPSTSQSSNQLDETNPIALAPQAATVPNEVQAPNAAQNAVPSLVPNSVPISASRSQRATTQVNPPKHSQPPQPDHRQEPPPAVVSPTSAPVPVEIPAVVPVVVPVVSSVAVPLPVTVPVAQPLPIPVQSPVKTTTPIRQAEPRSGDAPKPPTTPPGISTVEKVRQPDIVSFHARLTEHPFEEPQQQPPQAHEERPTPAAQDPPPPVTSAAPASNQTNPKPPAQARPEQIGYVPQKAPPATEPAPKSKPAVAEALHDAPEPEIKTPVPQNGAMFVSSTPVRVASASESKQAPPAAPPPPASTPADALKPAAAPSAIREISVRIPTQDNARGVEVQLVERAGTIEVTVRAGDQQISSALKGDLTDLVRMLDSKGYKTETWTPSDTNPLVHAATHGIAEMARTDTAQDRSGGQHQDSTGGGNNGSNSQQQRRQQQNRPAWLQELERRLGDA
jgi:hypothetical protein